MINITQDAAQEVRRLQSSRHKENSDVRLKINKGGCSGLFYDLQLNEKVNESDRQYESEGITFTIDADSLNFIENLQIDYSEDLMGGAFRFENAKSIKHCNCGQSFSVNEA